MLHVSSNCFINCFMDEFVTCWELKKEGVGADFPTQLPTPVRLLFPFMGAFPRAVQACLVAEPFLRILAPPPLLRRPPPAPGCPYALELLTLTKCEALSNVSPLGESARLKHLDLRGCSFSCANVWLASFSIRSSSLSCCSR